MKPEPKNKPDGVDITKPFGAAMASGQISESTKEESSASANNEESKEEKEEQKQDKVES